VKELPCSGRTQDFPLVLLNEWVSLTPGLPTMIAAPPRKILALSVEAPNHRSNSPLEAPSHSSEVSLRFHSEVLDCLPFLERRHPCLSEQADSNRIGSPHSFQTGMPALQGVPSFISKRPRFYCAAEGNSSLADLSLKQWLLTAARMSRRAIRPLLAGSRKLRSCPSII